MTFMPTCICHFPSGSLDQLVKTVIAVCVPCDHFLVAPEMDLLRIIAHLGYVTDRVVGVRQILQDAGASSMPNRALRSVASQALRMRLVMKGSHYTIAVHLAQLCTDGRMGYGLDDNLLRSAMECQ
ncbi:hypothetical protein BGP84_13410 [Pseudomonas putida]|uniref:Uncharacterized protein n=1 Tax=Pseudomonas putida TaxID=303 RepID=A0A2S3X531_PSEPU|nr:hypothetical protein BGP84_13410 [Pseudomonas putida]